MDLCHSECHCGQFLAGFGGWVTPGAGGVSLDPPEQHSLTSSMVDCLRVIGLCNRVRRRFPVQRLFLSVWKQLQVFPWETTLPAVPVHVRCGPQAQPIRESHPFSHRDWFRDGHVTQVCPIRVKHGPLCPSSGGKGIAFPVGGALAGAVDSHLAIPRGQSA